MIDKFRHSGLGGLPYEGYGEHHPAVSNLLTGMMAIEMARVDPSVSTFFGVHNGLAIVLDLRRRQPGAARPLAARDGRDGQDRRVRDDRAARRLRCRRRHAHHRQARGRHLGAQRRQAAGSATRPSPTTSWSGPATSTTTTSRGSSWRRARPGFSPVKIENKIAFRIVENAEITLTDVRVPEANRLQNIDSFRDVAEILRATRGGGELAGAGRDGRRLRTRPGLRQGA